MSKIAVVDFSWTLHRYKNSLKGLSCVRNGETIPTGHVYGTIKFIKELSEQYDRVILCRDSRTCLRKQISSLYKSNRHEKTGDWFLDYSPHQDSDNIKGILSYFKNVWFAEEEGFEADDLIAYFIKKSKNWDFYFRDADILQTRGEYQLMVGFKQPLVTGILVDRKELLQTKYGVYKDWLPIVWKMIKGDSGDCISIGLMRFPTKDLSEICNKFENDNPTFEEVISAILSHSYKGIWKDRIKVLEDKDSEEYKRLELNYKLVKPMLPNSVSLTQEKDFNIKETCESYNIDFDKIFSRNL